MGRIGLWAMALLALVGCDVARVVDCEDGRFVRAGGVAWCVYEERSAMCPRLLPEEHPLAWGGLACAEEAQEEVPEHPCLSAGECDAAGDAG